MRHESFCAPESAHVDLEIFKTTDGDYIVEDVNRNSIVLKVEGKLFKLHDGFRRNDAVGNPVVTLRKKKATAHARWQIFKGHSVDSNDLLFTALTSSMFQVKTKLHVFLANNTAEDVFYFKVEESCTRDSGSIYDGDASTIVAEGR
ncbi:Protein LURP-one-related 15 [Morella rubra]|uniref:Protein LURP-one-related 15 n=1 Tax=Morella rubra TaxID=262757 RepID=A0A6A1WLD0_9ROSI|nr:Protein LURP-one-related 15 [Morella rubra]